MRVTQSSAINELATALVAAHGELANPPRNKTVTVTPKRGSEYNFSYTTLDALILAFRYVLHKHQLVLQQWVHSEQEGEGFAAEEGLYLTTQLMHSSGQWQRATVKLPIHPESHAQQQGSALTYFRRYTAAAVLMLASDDDDDANIALGQAVHPTQQSQPAQPTQPQSLEVMEALGKEIDREARAGNAAEFALKIDAAPLDQEQKARLHDDLKARVAYEAWCEKIDGIGNDQAAIQMTLEQISNSGLPMRYKSMLLKMLNSHLQAMEELEE